MLAFGNGAMPHTLHQGLVALFADDPALAFDLMREVFGLDVPPLASITDRRSELDCFAPCFGDTHEVRPDLALSADLVGLDPPPGIALVIGVQRSVESSKRWRLWVYWALLAERLKRSTALMLVAMNDDVSRWGRRLGAREIPPREALLVLDRQNMPRITAIDEGRQRPAKALLSALLHARTDDMEVVVPALMVALELTDDRRWRYGSYIMSAVSERRRQQLKEHLTVEQRYELTDLERNSIAFHDGRDEGKLEGKLEGLVRLVLTILELRALPVDDASEQCIRSCTDPDTLERWASRAARASSVAELF